MSQLSEGQLPKVFVKGKEAKITPGSPENILEQVRLIRTKYLGIKTTENSQ